VYVIEVNAKDVEVVKKQALRIVREIAEGEFRGQYIK
jgi:hypothetical protein